MLDKIVNLAKKLAGTFALHGINDTAWDKLSGDVKAKAVQGLQAKLFGFGTNDESLTAEAFALAIRILKAGEENLKPTDLAKITMIWEIMAELTANQRNKLTSVIGRGQQKIKENALKSDGPEISWSEEVNIRGAELILSLCELPDKNTIRVVLKAMGTLDTGMETFFSMFKEAGIQIGTAINFALTKLDSNVELNTGIINLTTFFQQKTANVKRKTRYF